MNNHQPTFIEHLTLRNYRSFEQISVDFHSKLTVLVAENGAGKTALLDAVKVALQYFVDELRRVGTHGFEHRDVRLAKAPTGAMVSMVPTTLDARASIDGRNTSWRRELSSVNGRTTTAQASQLVDRARRLLGELGDFADHRRAEPPHLPVIAYYGTGRLWSEHKLTQGKKKAAEDLAFQTGAYLDCLSPSSSYGHFTVWFESVVREAQNELQTAVPSPHKPQQLLAVVRRAVDIVLRPAEWANLDWDFLAEEVVAVHPTRGRLPVGFLSDGIRNLIALVADLAHRAARLNPHLGADAGQMASGIVLIDEVDMHLHPSWQQTVVGLLQEAFPSLQFIVTTHSHLVVSTVPSECVRIIGADGSVSQPSGQTEGVDSPLVLGEVFGVDSVPPVEIAESLSQYRSFVEQGNATTPQAEQLWGRLVQHFGPKHPAILRVVSLARIQGFKANRGPERI